MNAASNESADPSAEGQGRAPRERRSRDRYGRERRPRAENAETGQPAADDTEAAVPRSTAEVTDSDDNMPRRSYFKRPADDAGADTPSDAAPARVAEPAPAPVQVAPEVAPAVAAAPTVSAAPAYRCGPGTSLPGEHGGQRG